jgi:hypothetical protein
MSKAKQHENKKRRNKRARRALAPCQHDDLLERLRDELRRSKEDCVTWFEIASPDWLRETRQSILQAKPERR